MFIKKRGKAKQAKAAAAAAAEAAEAPSASAPPPAAGGGAGFLPGDDNFNHRIGNYQLMEAIGKGGYGTVYRGLNIERGITVAVKRVNLQGIPHEELESIEMEIRLLQNLDHPNIVKYLDSIRSDDVLNIMLEFVENGSLSSLLVKFGGKFPEQLVSHYITQVLKGLQYLHQQGVIHRDIKGANILSTKEGQVKLADFGVATKLNETRKSDSVVGTPYWMAPEIIEMTGQQSSACDIWSVGCVTVELLTGKPPYFDLQQMPALFRIVQDEHPPLPDGISPALEDFLMQCFTEDTQILTMVPPQLAKLAGVDTQSDHESDDGEEQQRSLSPAATFQWLFVDQLIALQTAYAHATTQHSLAPSAPPTPSSPTASLVEPLRIASYNSESGTLEYHPLPLGHIIQKHGIHRMIDLQSDRDGAAAADLNLSLSVTHDHDVFVRLGRLAANPKPDDASSHESPENIEWDSEKGAFSKCEAESMMPHGDDARVVQMLAHAASGVSIPPIATPSSPSLSSVIPSSSPTPVHPSFAPLPSFTPSSFAPPQPSHNDAHSITFDAFLQLYGYWLGCDGVVDDNGMVLRVRVAHEHEHDDASVLLQLMRELKLMEGEDFTIEHETTMSDSSSLLQTQALIRIMKQDWLAYFREQYPTSRRSVIPTEATNACNDELCLLPWMLPQLNKSQLRLMLHSIVRACGCSTSIMSKDHAAPSMHYSIPTHSTRLRDELVVAALHAGYSGHFIQDNLSSSCSAALPSTAGRWLVEFSDASQLATPIIRSSTAVSERTMEGRVWCVTVPPHHLVMVRRAQIDDEPSSLSSSVPSVASSPSSSSSSSCRPVRCASRPLIVGQCFQKDPNRRIDANGLLKHPWLRRNVEMMEVEEMKKKMMMEQMNKRMTEESESESDEEATPAHHHHHHRRAPSKAVPLHRQTKSIAFPRGMKVMPGRKTRVGTAANSDNEDDWDGMMEEDDEDMAEFDEALAGADDDEKEDGGRVRFKGQKHAGGRKGAAAAAAAGRQTIDEEDEEEEQELVIKLRAPDPDDEDPFDDFSEEEEEVVARTGMKTIQPGQLLNVMPQAATATGTGGASATGVASAQVASTTTSAASSATSSVSFSNATPTPVGGPAAISATSSVSGSPLALNHPRKLEAFVENDEEEIEDYGDLEEDLDRAAAATTAQIAATHHAKPSTAVSSTVSVAQPTPAAMQVKGKGVSLAAPSMGKDDEGGGEEDETDPFDDITFEEGDNSGEDVQFTRSFLRVLAQLSPTNDVRVILDACEKLHEMGQKNPDTIRALMTSHGVIPIMEMLEVTNPSILHAVLRVINQAIIKNPRFHQNISLVGLIPAMIRFGGPNFPPEIRMEAASFIRQFCYASDWTRKMFIACDGLPVLVSFLMEEYSLSKTLVWNSIDCIRHVFDITTSPKNDFCRLFCKFGLLEPLTQTLLAIQADKESADAPDYVLKIGKILHLFSQGDKVVKNHFAKPSVIECMLRLLPQQDVPQELLLLLLKSIRNISMDSTTLDLLEAAGAIPALIPFLEPQQVSENQHQVLLTMYYLCQIKQSRQEAAALSGIIPHLQRFIRLDHPLKQFAYPIIFLLAKSSPRARVELKKYGGLQFYIDILSSADVYWRSYALEVLSFWVAASADETARASFHLATSSNINKLVQVFVVTEDPTQFDKMLPHFRKMVAQSHRVNEALGRCKRFINEIRARLDRHASSNNIRINLLKILNLLFAAHHDKEALARESNLLPVLLRLQQDKAAVIVGSLTNKLLTQYMGHETAKNGASSTMQQRSPKEVDGVAA